MILSKYEQSEEKVIGNFVGLFGGSNDYENAAEYCSVRQVSLNSRAYFKESDTGQIYSLTIDEVIGMGNKSARDHFAGWSK